MSNKSHAAGLLDVELTHTTQNMMNYQIKINK